MKSTFGTLSFCAQNKASATRRRVRKRLPKSRSLPRRKQEPGRRSALYSEGHSKPARTSIVCFCLSEADTVPRERTRGRRKAARGRARGGWPKRGRGERRG